MKLWEHISADSNSPLSVEEFRKCFESWLDTVIDYSDAAITRAFPDVEAVKRRAEEAVRAEKFQMYKEIYWEKLERYELDP